MSESYLVPLDIENLSFDSFARNPQTDVVCLAPIRTIIRREEEIVLVRKVRKVEEIDASLGCPVNSVPIHQGNQPRGFLEVYADREYDPQASFTNTFGRPIVVEFRTDEQTWDYGSTPGHNLDVSADGHIGGDVRSPRFPNIPPAALVAFQGTEVRAYGKTQQISLQPGETVYFVNNDQPNYYGDNRGVLRVEWSVIR